MRALENVSLTINHGDQIGIIGHNGAGKSTMLRVLAGIYEPSQGTIALKVMFRRCSTFRRDWIWTIPDMKTS